MTELTYRPPTEDDIRTVADRMRVADQVEVALATGSTPLQALQESVEGSRVAFAAIFDGRCEAIFGIAAADGMAASIWLLGTDELAKHKRLLVSEGRSITDSWTEWFPIQHNFVDAQNVHSIRWLRALGFTVADKATPYGFAESPFLYFWKTKHV